MNIIWQGQAWDVSYSGKPKRSRKFDLRLEYDYNLIWLLLLACYHLYSNIEGTDFMHLDIDFVHFKLWPASQAMQKLFTFYSTSNMSSWWIEIYFQLFALIIISYHNEIWIFDKKMSKMTTEISVWSICYSYIKIELWFLDIFLTRF